MRKIGIAILAGLTAISLVACSKQQPAEISATATSETEKTESSTTESSISEAEKTDTESSASENDKANTSAQEIAETQTTTPEDSKPQETSEGQTPAAQEERTPQEQELIDMLDEIERDGRVGEAGCSLTATKLAAHLMNWGVGTPLTVDQIKEVTISWLQPKGESEEADFSDKLGLVRDSYNLLLGEDAPGLLEDAGVTDAAYPWSDKPIETIEAVMQVVFWE